MSRSCHKHLDAASTVIGDHDDIAVASVEHRFGHAGLQRVWVRQAEPRIDPIDSDHHHRVDNDAACCQANLS